jgi:hypothetical protein
MILSFRAKGSGAERSRGISRSIFLRAPRDSHRFLDFVLPLQNFARNDKRRTRATTS